MAEHYEGELVQLTNGGLATWKKRYIMTGTIKEWTLVLECNEHEKPIGECGCVPANAQS